MFDMRPVDDNVSTYTARAIRDLRGAGWSLNFDRDDAIQVTHGKLVRDLPYTDSFGSLVGYNALQELLRLIRIRTQ